MWIAIHATLQGVFGGAVMVRINITFDHETLRLANRAARRRRTSRSEFIRDAVRAEEAGNWPATKIVHDWRYRLVNENK